MTSSPTTLAEGAGAAVREPTKREIDAAAKVSCDEFNGKGSWDELWPDERRRERKIMKKALTAAARVRAEEEGS